MSVADWRNAKRGGGVSYSPVYTRCGDNSNCSSSYQCVGGECKPTPPTSSTNPCPTGAPNNSSCTNCDPSCKNGVKTYGPGGTQICVPKDCSQSNICGGGLGCDGGECKPPTCSGYTCGGNLICCEGFCRSPDACGGACNKSGDCPSGMGCYAIYTNGTGTAKFECKFPGDEQNNGNGPDGAPGGKRCNEFCQQYYLSNGSYSNGCDDRNTCGPCSECRLGRCSPLAGSSAPCQCQNLPCGKTCSGGRVVANCNCKECYNAGRIQCPCGITLPARKICRSVCDPKGSINDNLQDQCGKGCDADRTNKDKCKGRCTTTTRSCEGFSCPQGLSCKQVGKVETATDTLCIFETCDINLRPDSCDNDEDNKVGLSISMIDEDDNYGGGKNSDWNTWRANNPNGYFYLGKVSGSGGVAPPSGFDGASIGIPRGGTMDLFGALSGIMKNVGSVSLWVDNSGSMTSADVAGTVSLFLSKCQAAGIGVCSKAGGNENWIAPHNSGGFC